ncbi:biotin--[acetyl-CoA-carboxylase] ligase [Flavobacterium sp. J27]|uniref:biotin--[acetyl-CoA-carboxylase] ligase n=1 Tax=Flavobacterium sp. J27 TaxID=2060419 RepID=UPI0010317D2D|nr:biotin--[acetyl-CoA-carboxylase] ligase [Flavobacterium sp. J27]
MNIIKLNAIDSTNIFLKDLSVSQNLENFTVVVTENQLKGKGQRGATWTSEDGKNLTFSIFINHKNIPFEQVYLINIITSLALVDVLQKNNLSNVYIKWPNDILSENKKICGILVENTLKADGSFTSIVGVGLNVNQEHFENLPQASSLALLKNIPFDKDILLVAIIGAFEKWYEKINKPELLWQLYHNHLFKMGIPTAFESIKKRKFMGIIKGVSKNGQLMVLLEDDTVQEFDIKEIKMLY